MPNWRWNIPAVLTALLSLGPARVGAQNVVEIQVQPPQVQLRVGERQQVFAQAFGQGNAPVPDAAFRWSSTDNNVVRVETDSITPDVGTLIGVGPGAAVVAAQVGPVRGFTTVQVTGAAPPPPPPVAAAPVVPDSVLPITTASTLLRGVVRIDAQRFGVAPACGTGAFVGRGLVVTSYQTIRGADRLTATPEGGFPIQDVRIASYSVASDMAILSVPSDRTDTLPLAGGVADNQYAWAVGYSGCQAAAGITRLRIATWENRPAGSLRHTAALPEAEHGAPLVDRGGSLVGVVVGDRVVAAPYARVQTTLGDARSNLQAQRLQTPDEVGRAENHLYGSFVARSEVAGATARVTPLERWQWTGLAREGPLPLTFTGPMGRYQVDLVVAGAVRASTTAVVTPGATAQVALAPPAPAPPLAAQPTPTPTPTPAPTPAPRPPTPQPVAKKGGGGAVIPLVILLAGGAGAGVYFLTKKKEAPTGGAGATGTTGSISISVPNP